jgi:SHS2 domain-containing protein
MQLDEAHHFTKEIQLSAFDYESLMVAFLSELIFIAEHERIGFDSLIINLENTTLHTTLQGARIISKGKAIKAVTFHNLKIIRTGEFLEAVLVFDV